jgi:hypothetical protein
MPGTKYVHRAVYAVAANSGDEAIATAWKYDMSNEAARELHGYPVALHKDDMPARVKAPYATVYKVHIAIVSLKPFKYDNRAEVWA